MRRLLSAHSAADHRLVGGDLLVEVAAERAVGHLEPDLAAAERARIVAQDLAGPFGVLEVLPALDVLLDEVGVDEQREVAGAGGQERAVAGERLCEVADKRQGSVRLERAFRRLQSDAGGAAVDEVADGAAGRLLGADALADLAGTAVEHLDRDAVFLLELVAQLAHDLEVGAVVNDDLAFFLRLRDHLVPVGLGGRASRRTGERRGEHGDTCQRVACRNAAATTVKPAEHRHLPPFALSVSERGRRPARHPALLANDGVGWL